MGNKLAQRQLVAEISPVSVSTAGVSLSGPTSLRNSKGPKFNGLFAQVTGGEITAPVEKVYDGGSVFPDVLCAPSEIGDVTVTRHLDRDRNDHISLKNVRQMVGRARYDIYVYMLNCDLKESGTERVYPGALLVGLTEPEGDSASGAPLTFSLTFSIGSVSAASS